MGESTKNTAQQSPALTVAALVGRVAVLGGAGSDKSNLLVGLAFQQVRQQGTAFCLDARHHQQVELQLRLLLRQQTQYRYVRVTGEVSAEVARSVLSVVGNSLSRNSTLPPLLLCDSLVETPDWEQTIQFLLKANATIVELLPSPSALVFGRYETVLLLRETITAATDVLSRAVGRKVSGEQVAQLKTGEGWLIHLTQVQRVTLPGITDEGARA